jgi:CRISPR-associated exonuclease Cas4
MNISALLPLMFVAVVLLAIVALAMIGISSRLRRQSGLPEGEVVYEDASGLARKPLFSRRLGLSGKPDYLLRDQDDNLIPVEVKSGTAPRGDEPYESHLLQIATYFLLIEDVLQYSTPYGLIRYRDRTLRVKNNDELREELMDVIGQMRALLIRGEAHRNHDQPQRCARCSMAHVCDERVT